MTTPPRTKAQRIGRTISPDLLEFMRTDAVPKLGRTTDDKTLEKIGASHEPIRRQRRRTQALAREKVFQEARKEENFVEKEGREKEVD
jgi:hypothetical protein